MRSFGGNIYTSKISIDETEIDKSNFLENIVEFHDKNRPKKKKIRKKIIILIV